MAVMKTRLLVSGFFALVCVSALAEGDTYKMTYQATATSRAATIDLLSFAIARVVQPPPPGGPKGAAQKVKEVSTNAGQIKIEVGKKPSDLSNTFKKGAQFAKMTIYLSGTTPAGATAPMRHWTITDGVIDSYAVTGSGPGAQAIINLHWATIKLATP